MVICILAAVAVSAAAFSTAALILGHTGAPAPAWKLLSSRMFGPIPPMPAPSSPPPRDGGPAAPLDAAARADDPGRPAVAGPAASSSAERPRVLEREAQAEQLDRPADRQAGSKGATPSPSNATGGNATAPGPAAAAAREGERGGGGGRAAPDAPARPGGRKGAKKGRRSGSRQTPISLFLIAFIK
jgi:hypothetical protein